MKCHYCGTEIAGNEIYCRHCGTRQQPAQQAQPVIVAAPVEPTPVVEAPVAPVAPAAPVATEPAPTLRPVQIYEEKTFGWQPYGGAPAPEEPLFDFEQNKAPKIQLPTKRGLGKMILFGILTAGIYPVVIWSRLAGEVNMVASRYDGERSVSFFGMLMLAPLTCGIHSLVWMHKLCRRIGAELQRRNVNSTFGAKAFWLWYMLVGTLSGIFTSAGSYLVASGTGPVAVAWALVGLGVVALVGPLVFQQKLLKAMNQMNADFNING